MLAHAHTRPVPSRRAAPSPTISLTMVYIKLFVQLLHFTRQTSENLITSHIHVVSSTDCVVNSVQYPVQQAERPVSRVGKRGHLIADRAKAKDWSKRQT